MTSAALLLPMSEHSLPEWLGELLFERQERVLEKASGHKYIRRVPTGKARPKYRYYYKATGGKHLGHEDEMQEGASFRVKHEGKEGHFHITASDGNSVTVRHDETGHEAEMSKAALRALLHKEHAELVQSARSKAKERLAKLETLNKPNRNRAKRHADEVHAAFGGVHAEPEKPKPEKKTEKPKKPSRADKHSEAKESFEASLSELRRLTVSGEKVTAKDLQESYRRLVADEEKIKAYLGSLTKKELKRFAGFTYSDITKPEMVDQSWSNLLQSHVMSDSISYGFGEGEREAAIKAAVDKMTDSDVEAYSARVQKRASERKAHVEEIRRRIEKPETLSDFREKIRLLGPGSITKDEQVKMDELEAEAAKSVVAPPSNTSNTKASILEGVHTKKGHKIWTVQLQDRVDRSDFVRLRDTAKALGGYYSSYKGRGAQPGFIFPDADSAQSFHDKLSDGGDGSKPDAATSPVDRKMSKNAEALREKSKRLMDKAEESLKADRQTNTDRRARMASSAREHAQNEKVKAQTMARIADAQESGNTHLWGVSAKTHVDALESVLRRAVYERDKSSGSDNWDSMRTRDPNLEDVDHLKKPELTIHRDHLQAVLNGVNGLTSKRKTGYARAFQKLSSLRDVTQKPVVTLETPDQRQALTTLLNIASKNSLQNYSIDRAKEAVRDFSRIHDDMGIKTEGQLRAVAREYLGLRGKVERDDPMHERIQEVARKKIPGYFPTPPPVIDQVMTHAGISKGMTVLEPSAGVGYMADAAKEAGAEVSVGEINNTLHGILKDKGHKIVARDALKHKKLYDRVIMNPPFEKRQDIDHVMHAYENQVKRGGKLVAIMSAGSLSGSGKKEKGFQDFIKESNAEVIDLPAGSFKDSDRKTGVSTKLVIIDKPRSDKSNWGEGVTDINAGSFYNSAHMKV